MVSSATVIIEDGSEGVSTFVNTIKVNHSEATNKECTSFPANDVKKEYYGKKLKPSAYVLLHDFILAPTFIIISNVIKVLLK